MRNGTHATAPESVQHRFEHRLHIHWGDEDPSRVGHCGEPDEQRRDAQRAPTHRAATAGTRFVSAVEAAAGTPSPRLWSSSSPAATSSARLLVLYHAPTPISSEAGCRAVGAGLDSTPRRRDRWRPRPRDAYRSSRFDDSSGSTSPPGSNPRWFPPTRPSISRPLAVQPGVNRVL
jgi:hypothetical protein